MVIVCLCVIDFVPQSGGYVLGRSGESGLWALSAGIRHESAERGEAAGQRAAPARREDQSDAVWPADAALRGQQHERQGENAQQWRETHEVPRWTAFTSTSLTLFTAACSRTCDGLIEPLVSSSQVMDFEGLVSSLNEQGFLLKKGAKLYQLQTVWASRQRSVSWDQWAGAFYIENRPTFTKPPTSAPTVNPSWRDSESPQWRYRDHRLLSTDISAELVCICCHRKSFKLNMVLIIMFVSVRWDYKRFL